MSSRHNERTGEVIDDALTTLARVLGGIFLSHRGLELLGESHSGVALVVVLHLHITVLCHLVTSHSSFCIPQERRRQ